MTNVVALILQIEIGLIIDPFNPMPFSPRLQFSLGGSKEWSDDVGMAVGNQFRLTVEGRPDPCLHCVIEMVGCDDCCSAGFEEGVAFISPILLIAETLRLLAPLDVSRALEGLHIRMSVEPTGGFFRSQCVVVKEEWLNPILHLLKKVIGGHGIYSTAYRHPVAFFLVEASQ